MTTFHDRAIDCIRDAEIQLRGLIRHAVDEGRYDEVAQIAKLSTRLKDLLGNLDIPFEAPAKATELMSTPFEATSANREKNPRLTREQSVTKPRGEYPRFRRKRNELVKIGWSPKAKKEYEHRVPQDGVRALVDYLVALPSSHAPLSAETVVEALASDEANGILGYQVYVVVAWLREAGVLVAQGRQGYTVSENITDVQSTVAELWEALPRCR